MKKLLTITSVAILLIAYACCGGSNCKNETAAIAGNKCNASSCCNATSDQLSGIKKALDLYVNAAVKGDSKVAVPAFAPTATMSYVENNKLVSVPIKTLFDYYDTIGAHLASYEISACNVADDVAMVRIESQFGDARFSDMFTLVKDGADWKIVSKVYHVK
ncbi:MAG: nuclear transport factor 2 family protein [Odoribacter sp.]|nr:nuclear transport factor 2 family protein [Odoribacter sp.]